MSKEHKAIFQNQVHPAVQKLFPYGVATFYKDPIDTMEHILRN